MKEDFVENRRRALEESFFANENARLIEKMRSSVEREKEKQALGAVSGITNPQVLDALIKAGIKAETMAALSLVPMVVVAWADGSMEEKERDAILRAFDKAGIDDKSAAKELVTNWLASPPDAKLEDAWRAYVSSLKESMDTSCYQQLKTEILGRARQVAEAAGGFLGLGSPVSKQENDALTRLAQAFD